MSDERQSAEGADPSRTARSSSIGPLDPASTPGALSHDTHSLLDTSSSPPLREGRDSPEVLPRQLGRYRVLRALGKGGMGAVYLAEDSELDRLVAIKVPFVDETDRQSVLERFRREAKAIATLQHPNICPVYDVAQVGEVHFMAMAYIEGKPLSEFLPASQPLPVRAVVLLVRRLALALHEAHNRSVVHRDLKPSNIMIDQRGQPIIMDFGLARRDDIVDTQLTGPGQLVGTPSYMAPEQVAGSLEAIGPACDIYSLGVILYQLLVGKLPFTGDLLSVLSQIANDPPKPPSHYRPEISAELEKICLRALMKDPGDRYESMQQFAASLTQFLLSDGSATDLLRASSPPSTESELDASATIEIFARWSEEELAIAATSSIRPRSRSTWIAATVSLLVVLLMVVGGGVLFSQWGLRPDETVAVQTAAAVDVAGRQAVPLAMSPWRQPDPTPLPRYLDGAQVFTRTKGGLPALNKRHILEFTVTKPGLVLIAASWTNHKDRDEAWFANHTTQAQMIEDGWIPIHAASFQGDRHFIFRRNVAADTSFKLHTNGVQPPHVILPTQPATPVVSRQKPIVLAGSDLSHVQDLVGYGTAPGPEGPKNLLLAVHDSPPNEKCDFAGLIPREVVRQGLLICAQEHFGVATRDGVIREPFPELDNPPTQPLGIVVSSGHRYQGANTREIGITVFQHRPSGIHVLWYDNLQVRQNRVIDDLAISVEQWSHGAFVEVLESLGYRKQNRRMAADGAVTQQTTQLLSRMNFIAQFAAIRELHRQIRDEGESLERLGALIRAYANLSVLTNFHWTPNSRVFAARALLYAQRYVVSDEEESVRAQWHRAYARAVVGQHRDAEASIRNADKFLEDHQRDGLEVAVPEWAELIRAYCQYDSTGLRAFESDESYGELCRLLQLIPLERLGNSQLVMDAAEELLIASPACFRAIDSMGQVEEVGTKRLAPELMQNSVSLYLYDEMLKIPQLPEPVAALAETFIDERPVVDPDNPNDQIGPLVKFEDELPTRVQLIQALREAGGRDSPGIPSWDLCASLVEDLSFVQVWRDLDAQRNWMGVSVDERLAKLLPLVEDHPYRFVIESQTDNADRYTQIMRDMCTSMDTTNITIEFWDVLQQVDSWPDLPWRRLADAIHYKKDLVYHDLAYSSYLFRSRTYASRLKGVSPNMPVTIDSNIRFNWDKVRQFAEDWLEKYNDLAPVLLSMGTRQLNNGEMDRAEATFKRCVELSPDASSYNALADAYSAKKDTQGWLETLEDFLENGVAYGLERANAASKVARYHMGNGAWQAALPYAELAAESFSGDGLLTAVQCHEGLGDFEQAEEYMQAMAHRYDYAIHWYTWCLRTGRGDLQAARQLAHDQLFGDPNPTAAKLVDAGMYHVISGEPNKALAAIRRSFEVTYNPYAGLFAVILAHEIGNTDVRDQTIARVIDDGKKYKYGGVRSEMIQFAKLLQKSMNKSDDYIDFKRDVDSLLEKARPGERVHLEYFFGRYLQLIGKWMQAELYFRRCANSDQDSTTRVLASVLLEDPEHKFILRTN